LLLLVAATRPDVTQAQPLETNLLPLNATWRYNHADCLDGVPWTTAAYDDTTVNWTAGPGGFTGGEANTAALLGVTTTSLPAPNSVTRTAGRAMYFRTKFSVTSTANLSLVFSNRIDDDAVFYLNGQRVADVRLTTSPALCASFGAICPYAGNDAVEWDVFTLGPAQLAGILVPGTNTLAVSVHQTSTTSSDMVFALSLTGVVPDFNPPPTLRMPAEPPSYGYSLVNGFTGLNFVQPVAIASPPGETNRLFVVNKTGTISSPAASRGCSGSISIPATRPTDTSTCSIPPRLQPPRVQTHCTSGCRASRCHRRIPTSRRRTRRWF
jgi:hypothetical protein